MKSSDAFTRCNLYLLFDTTTLPGHRVRQRNSSLYKALQRLRTKRRVVLTGYPLQVMSVCLWFCIFAFFLDATMIGDSHDTN